MSIRRLILLAAGLAALWGAYAMIRRGGERAGEAKVTARVERAHAAAIVDVRHDEHVAQQITDRAQSRAASDDQAASDFISRTIESQKHDLDQARAAAPAAVDVPVPDSVRASSNALVDHARGAADAADAAFRALQE